jgi:hypothetical protein
VDWSVVAHLNMNRQVERAKGMIMQGLKPRIFKRLEKFLARWVTELASILWSLRTTPSRATSFTPFFMVHGSEAVLPTDIDYVHEYEPTPRKATRSRLRMRSTSSMKREMWHSYVVPSTNKPYDATTSATCTLVSSKSET